MLYVHIHKHNMTHACVRICAYVRVFITRVIVYACMRMHTCTSRLKPATSRVADLAQRFFSPHGQPRADGLDGYGLARYAHRHRRRPYSGADICICRLCPTHICTRCGRSGHLLLLDATGTSTRILLALRISAASLARTDVFLQ